MIDAELIEEQGIIKIFPETSLEKEDFERLELLIDSWHERHGALHGVMIKTGHFPGWEDLDAMLQHFRFVREHHNQIRRVALVTDGALETATQRFAGPFVNAEVRSFSSREDKQAEAWVAGAGEQAAKN
ncbi:MAG: hypothetical protein PsegKO_27130 [Pseudohongiellaceae bacterium]